MSSKAKVKTSALNLPRKYHNEGGKYPQHLGKNKMSYSQYNSWIDPDYRLEYIVQYFSGIKIEPVMVNGALSDIWSLYGSAVGDYISSKAEGNTPEIRMLTPNCIQILDNLDYPGNSVYEDEIVIDCGDFCVQGFIDRAEYNEYNEVSIIDFKTGNVDTKAEFYASEDYGQTSIYSYQKDLEGWIIGYSGVRLLGRKGNGQAKYPLRLSGDIKDIPTPYSKERAEKVLEKIKKAAYEISDLYAVYNKYFGE